MSSQAVGWSAEMDRKVKQLNEDPDTYFRLARRSAHRKVAAESSEDARVLAEVIRLLRPSKRR